MGGSRDFTEAISNVTLNPLQQSVIMQRYVPLLNHIRFRTTRVSCMFHSSRVIITVGSLIVPALLSIQGANILNVQIYWSTWVISLLVTICNALMALFKFDKRYYYLHTVLEKLTSEGWQYIELTGKYSGYHTPGQAPTHDNQFIYFCHAIEKIRMKQVEEEYYKLSETPSQTPGAQPAAQDAKNSLIPPTPQQGELEQIPEDLQVSVKTQVARGVSPVVVANAGRQKENKKDQKNGKAQAVPVHFDV
jgi:hypothetical protein